MNTKLLFLSLASVITITAAQTISGYIGCYLDSASSRTLNGYTFTSSSMTNELCKSTCSTKGYGLCGTESGNQCFCGTSLPPSLLDPTPADCNSPCAGNHAETCGGTYKLSAYHTGQQG